MKNLIYTIATAGLLAGCSTPTTKVQEAPKRNAGDVFVETFIESSRRVDGLINQTNKMLKEDFYKTQLKLQELNLQRPCTPERYEVFLEDKEGIKGMVIESWGQGVVEGLDRYDELGMAEQIMYTSLAHRDLMVGAYLKTLREIERFENSPTGKAYLEKKLSQ